MKMTIEFNAEDIRNTNMSCMEQLLTAVREIARTADGAEPPTEKPVQAAPVPKTEAPAKAEPSELEEAPAPAKAEKPVESAREEAAPAEKEEAKEEAVQKAAKAKPVREAAKEKKKAPVEPAEEPSKDEKPAEPKKPAKDEAPKEEIPDLDSMKKAIMRIRKAGPAEKWDGIKALIIEYGGGKISGVPDDKRAEFMKKVEAL